MKIAVLFLPPLLPHAKSPLLLDDIEINDQPPAYSESEYFSLIAQGRRDDLRNTLTNISPTIWRSWKNKAGEGLMDVATRFLNKGGCLSTLNIFAGKKYSEPCKNLFKNNSMNQYKYSKIMSYTMLSPFSNLNKCRERVCKRTISMEPVIVI